MYVDDLEGLGRSRRRGGSRRRRRGGRFRGALSKYRGPRGGLPLHPLQEYGKYGQQNLNPRALNIKDHMYWR